MSFDWGVGQYERTASQLDTASATVIEAATIRSTEQVLDVASGTGNAALRAAGAGGRTVGVDRAERLVAVARERARQSNLELPVVTGDALDLPFADASFDVVLSVFGVIFVQPAERAAAELLRVVRPGGRIVLSAWAPAGPVHQVMGLVGQAMAAVLPPDDSRPPRTQWGDPAVLEGLFAPARVSVRSEGLAFVGPSARAWATDQFTNHPGWAAARAVLEPAGRWDELTERAIGTLEAANEDPDGFRITSGYLIATIERARGGEHRHRADGR
ncbi:MAG: class I SAM-dependent methyltransferase [Actinomycetota bacterium]|nr:class I SAM-dependent methyltransferase [Actinomycetota bacterium]